MEIICQDNEEYEKARRNWDPWTSLYPKCIAYVTNNDDIIKSIKYCQKHCIPIRIRSGGHSLGKDASSVNGGLIIDISALDHIRYHKNYVSVGAGIRIGPLIKTLAEKGYTFPNGDATTVGTGIIIGGGIGLTNKKLGLCCDNILGLKLITADCRVRKSDSDILWAHKGGGGGNFGIVTKFKVAYNKVPNQITRFDLKWMDVNAKTLKSIIFLWMNDIRGYSIDICTSVEITKNGKRHFDIVIEGLNYSKKPFKIPKCNNIGNPILTSVTSTYKDMVDRLNTPYRNDDNYQFASFWSDKILSKDIVDTIINYLKNNGSDCYFLDMGGKFNEVSNTAFPWRNAIFYYELTAIWREVNTSASLEIIRKKLQPQSLGSYVNVPNNNIKDYEKAYYGEHRHRLREIKRELDPNNFFNFSQSIRI